MIDHILANIIIFQHTNIIIINFISDSVLHLDLKLKIKNAEKE